MHVAHRTSFVVTSTGRLTPDHPTRSRRYGVQSLGVKNSLVNCMERKRTPQTKKELDYEKQHFSACEYPHAFRKNWPRKKARVNREYRRKADVLLSKISIEPAAALEQKIEYKGLTRNRFGKSVLRKRLRKLGVETLKERVDWRLVKRTSQIGRNYFKDPYRSEKHKAGFIRFLQSNVITSSKLAISYASFFDEVLDTSHRTYITQYGWLQCFFKDAAGWERTLRRWIATIEDAREKRDSSS